MSAKKKENLSLLVFCAPALMVYIIFKLFPAISGVFYALIRHTILLGLKTLWN